MSGIFVSYRRDDSSGYATLIYDSLATRFGRQQVFMDVDTLEPGVDYGASIDSHVGECDVMVALIGRRWLNAQAAAGRRLDDPADWVRSEVSAALARNVRVIPVLVDGAQMPLADELPEPLVSLSRREALALSPGHVRHDLQRLSDVIDRELRAHHKAVRGRARWRSHAGKRGPWLIGAGAIAAAVVVAAAVVALSDGHDGRGGRTTSSTSGNPYLHGRSCASGLYAGPNTSCGFAVNVRRAYRRTRKRTASVHAFSPVTHGSYVMKCTRTGSLTTCDGGTHASVAFDE